VLAADGLADYWRLAFLFLLLAVVLAVLLLGYAVWALRSGRRIRRIEGRRQSASRRKRSWSSPAES
jgi:hypothetical protein